MWNDLNQVTLTGSIAQDIRMDGGSYIIDLLSMARWKDPKGESQERKTFSRIYVRAHNGGGVSAIDRLKVGDNIFIMGSLAWNLKNEMQVVYAREWSFITRPREVADPGVNPIAMRDEKRYTLNQVEGRATPVRKKTGGNKNGG